MALNASRRPPWSRMSSISEWRGPRRAGGGRDGERHLALQLAHQLARPRKERDSLLQLVEHPRLAVGDDLDVHGVPGAPVLLQGEADRPAVVVRHVVPQVLRAVDDDAFGDQDRKSTRLNSSHLVRSYAV